MPGQVDTSVSPEPGRLLTIRGHPQPPGPGPLPQRGGNGTRPPGLPATHSGPRCRGACVTEATPVLPGGSRAVWAPAEARPGDVHRARPGHLSGTLPAGGPQALPCEPSSWRVLPPTQNTLDTEGLSSEPCLPSPGLFPDFAKRNMAPFCRHLAPWPVRPPWSRPWSGASLTWKGPLHSPGMEQVGWPAGHLGVW